MKSPMGENTHQVGQVNATVREKTRGTVHYLLLDVLMF